jgi:hypothetical protein
VSIIYRSVVFGIRALRRIFSPEREEATGDFGTFHN